MAYTSDGSAAAFVDEAAADPAAAARFPFLQERPRRVQDGENERGRPERNSPPIIDEATMRLGRAATLENDDICFGRCLYRVVGRRERVCDYWGAPRREQCIGKKETEEINGNPRAMDMDSL